MAKENPVYGVSVGNNDSSLEMYFNNVEWEDYTESDIRSHYENHPKGSS
jgi:hypothetical protein